MTSGSNNPAATAADFARIPIAGILPQRKPYLLVDSLVYCDLERTACRFRVPAAHVMVAAGRLTPSGLVENVAQTCAARIGYVHKYILHQPVTIGYVAALRDMTICRRPRSGETIVTEITVRGEAFGMTLAEATVRGDTDIIATAEIKVALGDKIISD